jgi:hypothetical protein
MFLDHEQIMNIPMVGISPRGPICSHARKILVCSFMCSGLWGSVETDVNLIRINTVLLYPDLE